MPTSRFNYFYKEITSVTWYFSPDYLTPVIGLCPASLIVRESNKQQDVAVFDCSFCLCGEWLWRLLGHRCFLTLYRCHFATSFQCLSILYFLQSIFFQTIFLYPYNTVLKYLLNAGIFIVNLIHTLPTVIFQYPRNQCSIFLWSANKSFISPFRRPTVIFFFHAIPRSKHIT